MCYIANHNYRLIYFNLPLKNLTLKIPPSSTISYQLSYKNTVTAHIGSKTHILDAFVAADIPLEKEIGCMNILMKEKGAIGQLIIQILVQWEIPFDSPQLVASDSAAYMKKFEKINSDFTDQQSNGRIEIYLAFIQENAQQFVAEFGISKDIELVNSSISLIQEWSIYININLNLIEFTE
ncbi:hypothetical protein GLOIN_2v1761146 [Rhizophagus irregularis DAOM 181602=DAOM 197198]|nr:hypothetical protein GLOIN_2v1761146 [Rhizophagus irregularis DAOM 181602=DAOM 197198]